MGRFWELAHFIFERAAGNIHNEREMGLMIECPVYTYTHRLSLIGIDIPILPLELGKVSDLPKATQIVMEPGFKLVNCLFSPVGF